MFQILELHDISPLIYVFRFFRMNTAFNNSQTRLGGIRNGSVGVQGTECRGDANHNSICSFKDVFTQ